MTDQQHYRRTRATLDPDAREVNRDLNDVLNRAAIGQKLKNLYRARFRGHPTAFRRWITEHLDASAQTVARYMALSEHAATLEESGVIDLVSAYDLLGICGAIPASDPIWGVTEGGAA